MSKHPEKNRMPPQVSEDTKTLYEENAELLSPGKIGAVLGIPEAHLVR